MKLQYFNLGHFYYLIFTIILIVALILILRKKSQKVIDIVILSLMGLNILQHVFKQEFYSIFDSEYSCRLYQRTFYNFCACLILVSPLIYLSKSVLLKNTLFYTGLGGSLLALFLIGDYTGKEVFSADVIRYFLCHILLLATSTIPVFIGKVKLSFKKSFFVPLCIYAMMGIIILNNVIMVGSGNYPITYKTFFDESDGFGGLLVKAKDVEIYEIGFQYEGKSYDYQINSETGQIINKNSSLVMEYAQNQALNDVGLYGNEIIFDKSEMVLKDGVTYYFIEFIYYNIQYQYYITLNDYQVFEKKFNETTDVSTKEKNKLTADEAISIALADNNLLDKTEIVANSIVISQSVKSSPVGLIKKIFAFLTPKCFLTNADGEEYYWPILWSVIPLYLSITTLCLLTSFLCNKYVYKEKEEDKDKDKKEKKPKKEKAIKIGDITKLAPVNNLSNNIVKEKEEQTDKKLEDKKENESSIIELIDKE